MTFTDDDLKRLKKHVLYHHEYYQLSAMKLTALLARLEAAEKVCELADSYSPESPKPVQDAITAWRKTAGK